MRWHLKTRARRDQATCCLVQALVGRFPRPMRIRRVGQATCDWSSLPHTQAQNGSVSALASSTSQVNSNLPAEPGTALRGLRRPVPSEEFDRLLARDSSCFLAGELLREGPASHQETLAANPPTASASATEQALSHLVVCTAKLGRVLLVIPRPVICHSSPACAHAVARPEAGE